MSQTIEAAAAEAAQAVIRELIPLLQDAQRDLAGGNSLAGWGSLVLFEHHANMLNAAIQLRRMANSRKA